MSAPTCDPAAAARKILDAFQSGDAALLEGELSRVGNEPASRAAPQADGGERLELLGAVAGALRSALDRMRRGRSERLEGGAVQLRLLRHLAAGSAQWPLLSRK